MRDLAFRLAGIEREEEGRRQEIARDQRLEEAKESARREREIAHLDAGQLSQSAFARLPHALRYTQPIYDFLQTLNSPGAEGLVAQLSEPDDLPEGPEVITVDLKEAGTEEVRAEVTRIITGWVDIGYCLPEDVLILHTRTELKTSVLGACETISGLPLVEYGAPPEEGKKAIRHLSINRAKGLDALAVVMVCAEPFQKIARVDNRYTNFMGASRAKQMLAGRWRIGEVRSQIKHTFPCKPSPRSPRL